MSPQMDPQGEPYLFDVSSRYTAGEAKNEEIRKGKKAAERVVSKHGLPSGYSIQHEGEGMSSTGELPQTHTTHLRNASGDRVGYVRWNPANGHVDLMSVDEGERPLTTHLLNAAHDWANKEGVDGPTNSDILSEYAYKMAKKHAPQSIPADAYVANAPIKFRGEDFLQDLHGMRSSALELDAKTRKMDPTYGGSPLASTLHSATRLHQNGDFVGIKSLLYEANSHASQAIDHVRTIDHPEARALKQQWYDLQDRVMGSL